MLSEARRRNAQGLKAGVFSAEGAAAVPAEGWGRRIHQEGFQNSPSHQQQWPWVPLPLPSHTHSSPRETRPPR